MSLFGVCMGMFTYPRKVRYARKVRYPRKGRYTSLTIGAICSGRISHDGFTDRCDELGWGKCGENVAYNKGYPDGAMGAAKKAMEGWWDSPGHKANILSDNKSHGSVGYYLCEDGRYYFTGLFGK